jgi:hypothetical protein
MADSKELAEYVKNVQEQSLQEELSKGKNYMIPKPPAPGEYINCQICGRVMLPQDFSKDPKIRKHEFKWHIHWTCEQGIWDQIDRQTPGLIAERSKGINVGRGFKQQDVHDRH